MKSQLPPHSKPHGSSFISLLFPYMTVFLDDAGNEISRTRCEIYTRVMGYYRPVTQFNNGKKSEFYTREYFSEDASNNSRFMTQYA